MSNKIVVIHKSEIFVKGLKSIIRSNFNIDLIHLCSLKEISTKISLMNSYVLFIIDQDLKVDFDINVLSYLKERIQFDVLWLNIYECEENNSLSMFSSINEVVEKVDRLLGNGMIDKDAVYSELSSRELDVLKLVAKGRSNKDIADILFISIHTVISHRKNITEKLGIKSIPGLTVYAILHKLVDPSDIS